MLASIYRKLIPQRIRESIYSVFLGAWMRNLRFYVTEPLKAVYYRIRFAVYKPQNEEEQALKEWSIVGPCPYPYLWVKEYWNGKALTDIHTSLLTVDNTLKSGDNSFKKSKITEKQIGYQNKLPYVMHRGRKLFFKRGMTPKLVCQNYLGLLIEQDKRSAHCYVSDYAELEGRTLLDIGSAEGIFTLDTIDHIRHAYLFESEDEWIDALRATFEPWKEKITIVKKYVSDTDNEQHLTLDTYFSDKPTDNLFLKMDVEGYERQALRGARSLLSTAKNISGAVCIYHKKDDPEVISQLLTEAGLTVKQTDGYLYMSRELRPGVLRFY